MTGSSCGGRVRAAVRGGGWPARVSVALASVTVFAWACRSAAAVDATFFEQSVAPILEAKCIECHNDVARKGRVALDTRAGVLGTLDEGVGRHSASSSTSGSGGALLDVVRGPEPEMPKEGDPLTEDELSILERWVAAGVPWTEGRILVEKTTLADTEWWSLRPLVRPDLPAMRDAADSAVVRTPIDRFVFAKQRELGLTRAPEADRRTLIRRLYFDLIGLPPTPEEIDAFVADPAPDAYEKLVEALLASPRYGERWARHWLDVAHYGDTHGYDKDKPRANAWPYRDYVIRAFNEDKPYERFVREQLAGDVLWPDTVDGIVATGFIAAGPWDFIGHAEVPEDKYDGMVARHLDRDDMVASTMNSFCSLTAQCAQCHDHKRDPVSMEDYYSLQAVFAALDRADRPYDPDPTVAARRAELQRALEEVERERAAFDAVVRERATPEFGELESRIAAMESRLAGGAGSTTDGERPAAYGYHADVAVSPDVVKWVQVDLGRPWPIRSVVLAAADEYGWADFGFPHRFRVEAADEASFADPAVLADFTGADFERPGAAPVVIEGGDRTARFVRVTATRLWNRRQAGEPETGDWIFALGELAVVSGDEFVPAATVTAHDSIEAPPRWSTAALVDGIFGMRKLEDLSGEAAASPTNGYHSAFAGEEDAIKWVQVDLGESGAIERIDLVPARPTDFPDTPGFGFPRRYRIEVSENSEFGAGTAVAVVRHEAADVPNPGSGTVSLSLPAEGVQGRYVRLTATRTWPRPDGEGHLLALAEMRIFRDGNEVSRGAEVTALDTIDSGRWHRSALVDGWTSRDGVDGAAAKLLAGMRDAASGLSVEDLEVELREARERHRSLRSELLGAASATRDEELAMRESTLREALAGLPDPAMVFAGTVYHGSGAFIGRGHVDGKPRPIHVLARGELRRPEQRVGPGVPDLVPGAPARFGLGDDDPEGLRRVALAEWIVHPDNPLTWRSIVNRIWQYHFGAGIVESPNDFGRLGELPTHPELLDWLAVEFRDGGGSVKDLHRLMCNSATYRLASRHDEENARIDSSNRFLWRMNRRRLEAEAVRDSVLAVSGKLDLTMFGPGFEDFVVDKPEHSPHYQYHRHDPDDPTTHRRAIYRFIVRSQPQPWMNTLDCADPAQSVPRRDETLTALQALALLNNRFVVRMAEHFAARIESEDRVTEVSASTASSVSADARLPTIEDAVVRAHRLALGRDPEAAERDALTDYARRHGMAAFCRVLFNLNEFVFVD